MPPSSAHETSGRRDISEKKRRGTRNPGTPGSLLRGRVCLKRYVRTELQRTTIIRQAVIVDVPVAIAPYPLHPLGNKPDDGQTVRLELGNPKPGWLNALFESARTSKWIPSVKAKVLPSERLTRSNPGPVSWFRRSSPNVPGAGAAKAASLNH